MLRRSSDKSQVPHTAIIPQPANKTKKGTYIPARRCVEGNCDLCRLQSSRACGARKITCDAAVMKHVGKGQSKCVEVLLALGRTRIR